MTRYARALALLTAVAVISPTPAMSFGLTGITKVRLYVLDEKDNARSCGINKDALTAAMRTQVSRSKLRIVANDDADGVIGLRLLVHVIRTRAGSVLGCAALVDMEMRRWSNEFRDEVAVWGKGILLNGEVEGFGEMAREQVEESAAILIGHWLKANP
jgi:hypothetical protein